MRVSRVERDARSYWDAEDALLLEADRKRRRRTLGLETPEPPQREAGGTAQGKAADTVGTVSVGLEDLGLSHLHAVRSRQQRPAPPGAAARKALRLRDGTTSKKKLGETIERLSKPSTRPDPFRGLQSTEH